MMSMSNNFEVPSGDPEANEAQANANGERGSRKLWAGAAALVLVAVICIAVPLAIRDNGSPSNGAGTSNTISQALKQQSDLTALLQANCRAPTANDSCTTEESYQQCKDLVMNGCEMVISTFSCPPHHACKASASEAEEELEEEAVKKTPSSIDCPAFAGTDETPDCTSCLENGCVWSVGRCMSSCMFIADAPCWDASHPRYADDAPADVCALAEPEEEEEEEEEEETGFQTSSQCRAPEENERCITEESYQECLALENVGCDMIISTFSCPPHHVCGSSQPEEQPTSSMCRAPVEGDSCSSEESYQECLALEAAGCPMMIATASCPPKYSCPALAMQQEETTQPKEEEVGFQTSSQCRAPEENERCITEESYQECLALENVGCDMIISTFSCPPHHVCGSSQPEEQPTSSMCRAPVEGDSCSSEESYQECLALEAAGCPMMIATASCPPKYSCPALAMQQEEVTAATTTEAPTSQMCLDPPEGDECSTSDSYQECLALEAAGCPMVIATFSCPPKYSCPAFAATLTEAPTEDASITEEEATAKEESQCQEPADGDMCSTQASYEQCLALEESGCQQMIATMSCPPRYVCTDPVATEAPSSNNASTSQCRPPVEGDMCNSETSYQQCLRLEEEGCQTIIQTASCPPRFSCGNP